MEDFLNSIDWSLVIGAVGGIVVTLIFSFYSKFKAAAAADEVSDWKDEVVKAIDGLSKKIDDANEPKVGGSTE